MIEIILNNKEGYRYDGSLDCLLEELNLVEGKYLELLQDDYILGIPHSRLGAFKFKQIEKNKIQIEIL